MTRESIEAAYHAAGEIAYALGILKVLWSKSARDPTVADGICKFVSQVVLATRRLGQIKENEAAMFHEAAKLYADVVRCGNRADYSYLELALRFGEITMMPFLPHADSIAEALVRSDSSGLDASGIVAAWDASEKWFGILDDYGTGLDVALEKELCRLTGEVTAQLEVESPPPPFPVTVDGNVILVDGEKFPVQPHHAKWVQMLLEARLTGEKVSGSQFKELPGCRGKNVSREFSQLFKLIPKLTDLITSDAGHGGGWYFNR